MRPTSLTYASACSTVDVVGTDTNSVVMIPPAVSGGYWSSSDSAPRVWSSSILQKARAIVLGQLAKQVRLLVG